MFDLYFAGSSYKEVMDYSKQKDICKLFSQYTDRKYINNWCEEKKEGKITNKLFIDSGAFTAHTKGISLDVEEYINYINNLGNNFDLVAQVDKIPGKFRGALKTKQDLKDAPHQSWENYLYMRDRVVIYDKLIPIFHQGEDFLWLENMLNWKDSNNELISYIGISSAKDKPINLRGDWYWKVFSIVQKSCNPKVKIHSFGTSSIGHLELFPFTSSDATSWIKTAGFGGIYTKFGIIAVSERQKGKVECINNCPITLKELGDYVSSFGFNLKDLMYDYDDNKSTLQRQLFNICYFKHWADNYIYKGPSNFIKEGLF